ncbi:uncharacterized protein LOC119453968 isoform X1 [Dermacentor silvarum]|uniref:uncharacterized protein LOC119453968 isoform X1 n=1 Tax=Dermacentor silvarum TaxID=543639 RepID=UPI00210087CE|nr:uncharacterized protein LOC119453968 isoform X1 [Dermacentor silvarum]
MVPLVTVISFLAAVVTATESYGLQRMPERRVRRTVDALCGSERFVNAVVRTLMDESRPLLSATEPLVLGDGPEYGGVRLRRGQLWGAATVHMREPLLLRCDPLRVAVAVHVALNNSQLAYDWEADTNTLLGSRGTASVFARHMSLKAGVLLPRKVAGALSPIRVTAVRITELIGADVTVSGPWPFAALMSAAANLLLKSFPDQVRALMADPLRDGLQRYLDENLA